MSPKQRSTPEANRKGITYVTRSSNIVFCCGILIGQMAEFSTTGIKYTVYHQLGSGGMGVVHFGSMVTPAGTRNVAIKQLVARRESEEAAERMVAEARLVFQLNHANICQVLDLATSESGTFIVMEYVDGCDLHSLLGRQQLDVPAAVYVAREIARALDYAHRRKDADGNPLFLVHGDVTPKNILLSREGEVKLADFGIARALGTHAPGNLMVGGTPGFIAPEAQRGSLDQRSDVYALGVTLYAALGGKPSTIDLRTLADRSVTAELVAIVERATAASPQDRYSTASDLERALGLHIGHKFPSFSPSAIGQLVQAHIAQPEKFDERSLTLVSLTQIGGATTLPGRASSPAEPAVFERTQRAAPKGRSKAPSVWRFAAIGASLIGLVVALTVLRLRPQQLEAARAVAPAPPPISVAAPSGSASDPQPPPLPTAETSEPKAPTRAKHGSPRKPVQSQPSANTDLGYLTVNADPWGAVFVDGKKMVDATPAYRMPIAAGTHRISVGSAARKQRAPERVVQIRKGELSKVGFQW